MLVLSIILYSLLFIVSAITLWLSAKYMEYLKMTKTYEKLKGHTQFLPATIAALLPSFLLPKGYITEAGIQIGIDGIKRMAKEYQTDCFKLISGLFGLPLVIIDSPDAMKDIAVKGDKNYVKNKRFLISLNELFGRNLFSEWDPSEHYRIRHLVEPAFSPDSLVIVGESTNNTCVNDMIPLMKKDNKKRDVMNDFAYLTLDVIGKAGFGYSFNSFKEMLTKEESSLAVKTQLFFKYFNLYGLLPSTWLRKKTKIGIYGVLHDAADQFQKSIKEIIETREKEFNNCNDNDIDYNDILTLLLKARRDTIEGDNNTTLSDAELIANAFILIVAGHETTARTLGFCCYLLATNPHVQEKLQNFVDEFIKVNQKDTFDYEDFKNGKLEYIRALFKETLRLFPVATGIIRELTKPVQWKEHSLPKGSICLYSWVLSHRNPNYWENPEEFKPERFLDENGKSYVPVKNPFVYSPFGVGNRICIGRQFAEVEAVIAIAHIAKNFTLKLSDPNYKMDTKVFLTLQPKDNLLVDFEERK
ncbi:hypothetical protein ABK040_005287 [Willaertia magna]